MRKYNIILIKAALILIVFITLMKLPCYGVQSEVQVRIKDLISVQGNNENQLIGYGLVSGLQGTGDRSKTLSGAMLQNMMKNMGIDLDDKDIQRLQTKNSAVVMITASLPASFRSGDAIDATVSSIGDATSLDGGVLLLSTLKGPDGKIYASAQGPISIGSEGEIVGKKRNTKRVVGTIPGGALISRAMDVNYVRNGEITLVLKSPDFKTADSIAKAINRHVGRIARTSGDRFVIINAENHTEDPVNLMSKIGELEVTPDTIAKVVINERTGTVIMGSNVKILPVTISHGNLTLNVGKGNQALQMAPEENVKGRNRGKKTGSSRVANATTKKFFKGGDGEDEDGTGGLQNTTKTPEGLNAIEQGPKSQRLIKLGGNATVKDVIDILNYLDISPRDLITILKALKRAGALQAQLEII